jgi:hypothetical protein
MTGTGVCLHLGFWDGQEENIWENRKRTQQFLKVKSIPDLYSCFLSVCVLYICICPVFCRTQRVILRKAADSDLDYKCWINSKEKIKSCKMWSVENSSHYQILCPTLTQAHLKFCMFPCNLYVPSRNHSMVIRSLRNHPVQLGPLQNEDTKTQREEVTHRGPGCLWVVITEYFFVGI